MISKKFLEEQLKKATYRQDKGRISVLRLLLSAIHNQEISKRGELTEKELLSAIRKEGKNRQESIEIYRKANRVDLAEKEEAELAVLKEFMPQELSDDQIRKAVKEIIKKHNFSAQADFGSIMGELMAQFRGQVDGSLAAKIVREELAS